MSIPIPRHRLPIPTVAVWLGYLRRAIERVLGRTTVAVQSTHLHAPIGDQEGSAFRSFLSVHGDGIRFRVLSEANWRFSDIDRVDAAVSSGEVHLTFHSRMTRRQFVAYFTDAQSARRLLQALPGDVMLSRRAEDIRDDRFPLHTDQGVE